MRLSLRVLGWELFAIEVALGAEASGADSLDSGVTVASALDAAGDVALGVSPNPAMTYDWPEDPEDNRLGFH